MADQVGIEDHQKDYTFYPSNNSKLELLTPEQIHHYNKKGFITKLKGFSKKKTGSGTRRITSPTPVGAPTMGCYNIDVKLFSFTDEQQKRFVYYNGFFCTEIISLS